MYKYEEVLESTLQYFNNDDLAAKVWIDKYALRDNDDNILEKNPDDMHKRLAKEFARIEAKKFKEPLSEKRIYSLLQEFRYIVPQGSPMFGIGNPYQTVSISNCYLLEQPLDSYPSILKVDEQLVNISRRRGGVGIDLDNLRPEGTPTKNAAKKSTGIVSWMRRYSNSIREVGQSGRRGALMLTLSIHHPDILKFATIKNDDKEVTGANISVKLSREFVNALENDEEYELRWPVNSKTPKIRKMVKASDVWKTIIHSAWLRAEPGILAWYNTTENTPADCYEEYKSIGVNPCLPGWSKILTKNGIRELNEVDISDEIWSETGWTRIINKWSTGVKKVFKYETSVGNFYSTENHKIVSNGVKIEIKDTETIDQLSGEYNSNLILDAQDITDGLVIGDGGIHKASNNIILYIGKNDFDYFNSEISQYIGKQFSKKIAFKIKTTILNNELPKTFFRSIPERFLYGSKSKVAGFLRGLYSANGSICGGRVTLKTSSKDIRDEVLLMLSSLGISSYYTINKPSEVKFSNGTYLCKESYDVNISKDIHKFQALIGFIQKYKNDKLENVINNKFKNKSLSRSKKTSYEIKSSTLFSEEEVFDITVDNHTHTYWSEGFNISNCSEINLSPLDSCRLLCLNLYSYVLKPFTSKARFDYKLFYEHSQIAQRLMDDMVDLESEKIDAILDKIKSDPEPEEVKRREYELWEKIKRFNNEGRRTGTGITALGDCLAALGIDYGSEESIKATDEIYKTLKFGCYSSSIQMAKELGTFKCWDYEKEKDCQFLKNIKNEGINQECKYEENSLFVSGLDLYNDMTKYGRRNIALLTTAPTGTVSIMTQTSSGIEPVFMTHYTRRKKINHNDKNTRVDFVDQSGDSWQEFTVYHPKIKEWMLATGQKDVSKSPWYKCTAEEIDWINRVKLQATAQKHVCHAISSTINLPENVSEEKISEIYLTAFKSGCKGMTVYRNNCRSGVLVETKKKNNAPKREKTLDCDIYSVKVKGEKFFVIVGLLNGPYEVFAGKQDFELDKLSSSGKIEKVKRGQYKLIIDGETICENVCDHLNNEEEAVTRLISTSLRHNVDLNFLVHQLEKSKGELNSLSKAISRCLKKYIEDGVKISGEECPECGGKLIRESGCSRCSICSYSKCN